MRENNLIRKINEKVEWQIQNEIMLYKERRVQKHR